MKNELAGTFLSELIVAGATFLREDFKLKGQSFLHHVEGKKKLASKIPLPELLKPGSKNSLDH